MEDCNSYKDFGIIPDKKEKVLNKILAEYISSWTFGYNLVDVGCGTGNP